MKLAHSEAAVKRALKAFLKLKGAYQFWPVQTGLGAATVDCLFCLEGRFFAVETKRGGVVKATLRQNLVMSVIIAAGGHVCVENDPMLPNVKRMLDALQL